MINGYPRRFAITTPDKMAAVLHPSGDGLSYAQLEGEANRFAHLLRGMGLKPGNRVAFRLHNTLEVFPFVWGAQRAGMLYVAISTKFTADEVAAILDDCQASLLLASDPHDDGVVASLAGRFGKSLKLLGIGKMPEGWEDWNDALAEYPAKPIADECFGSDMMYSSGTTGKPKGISSKIDPAIPADAPPIMAILGDRLFHMSGSTVYLSPAPLYHAAPLRACMAVQYLGGTVVIQQRFDAEEVLRAIARYGVTMAQFVPTHFNRLLDLPQDRRSAYDLSTLRCAIHAAAPCPEHTKRRMIEWWGPIIDEYYSGSEGAGMTFINSADWLAHPGSVGRAVLGTIRICDDDGFECPTGEIGRVFFEGGRSFEYHNNPEKTATSKNARGWSTMGDIGRLDEDGFLYLTDRQDFMIISGGVNVYPQQIENHLISHPLVRDIAVVGTPCRDLGEMVTAVVQLHDPADANDDTRSKLVEFARERLSTINIPKQFIFADNLPRTDTGKLLKKLIIQQTECINY